MPTNRSQKGQLVLILVALLLGGGSTPIIGAGMPLYRSLPATKTPTSRDALTLPNYRDGKLITLRVGDRFAYLIKPTGRQDSSKRWVWIFPFEHALSTANGSVEHRFYVNELLAAGFCVAGIDVGVSCGSPRAAERCEDFHRLLVEQYGLNPHARLLAQSNGGLIAYAWAYRHPRSVDRIAGIYPATDLNTWPGLQNLVAYPAKGLGFDLTEQQLALRLAAFNPIENLAPLAKAQAKLLHIHGDHDKLVPIDANSIELVRRYKSFGGSADLIVVKGLGHGGVPFFQSRRLLAYLLAD
jgi:pimeloyl-ACP methyl ester carboxylesterase